MILAIPPEDARPMLGFHLNIESDSSFSRTLLTSLLCRLLASSNIFSFIYLAALRGQVFPFTSAGIYVDSTFSLGLGNKSTGFGEGSGDEGGCGD